MHRSTRYRHNRSPGLLDRYSDNPGHNLNLVKIPSGSADRRVTRRIRWSREAHLGSVLRLEVRNRTKIQALCNSRAFGEISPLDPTGILVRSIGDAERDITFQLVDEQVARIETLQAERNLEVVGASLHLPLDFLLRSRTQVHVELVVLCNFPNLNRVIRTASDCEAVVAVSVLGLYELQHVQAGPDARPCWRSLLPHRGDKLHIQHGYGLMNHTLRIEARLRSHQH